MIGANFAGQSGGVGHLTRIARCPGAAADMFMLPPGLWRMAATTWLSAMTKAGDMPA